MAPVLLTAILAVLLLVGPVAGQVSVWRSHWDAGLDNRDEVVTMALTPEEDVIAVGFTVLQHPMSRVAIGIVRFAAGDGEIDWARTWQSTAGSADFPTGVAVDDSGNIFVSGYSHTRSADSTDWLVLKYLSDGTEAWQVRHHHLLVDVATAVVPDGAGGCYVAGHSTNAAGNLDFAVAHYDADGNENWLTLLGGAANGNDAARALVYDGDGHLYAAGHTWTGSTDSSAYWLVKLDAATGDTAWTRTYQGSAGSGDPRDDRAHALALGPDGTIYVTGRAGEQGNWYDATTVCWDADGDRRWVNRFDAGRNAEEGASEIAVDAHGNAYVGGYTFDYYLESEMDLLVQKIRPDGITDWYRVHDSGFNEDDSCTALVLDDYGNVYVAGIVSDNVGCADWAVMKYSPSGERRWLHLSGVYDEDDFLYSLLVDSRGHVYAGGVDYYLGDDDFAVLKLGQQDVGVTAVLEPSDTLRLWAEITPRVRVRNNSPVPQSFPVWLYIGNFYFDARHVADLAPYDSAEVEFNPWLVRDAGDHAVVSFTALGGDHEPANDTARVVVTTVPAWEFLEPMAQTIGRRQREVRDGGALACYGDSLVYALKGNNTTEFLVYDARRDSWRHLDTVPRESPTGRRRRVRRGAKLAAGPGRVYALKGSNTTDFLYYPVSGDSGWQWLAPYPTGGGRRVRGGGGLEYVPALDRLYSAKGSNTLEFFAYDVVGDSWLQLADVHPGPRNRRVRYGSTMTYDGDDTIYLLKASVQELHAYSISADAWTSKPEMPYSAYGRRRKVRRDAAIAFDAETGRLWASKGGKSSEWWYFDVSGDSWVEVLYDTIPMGPSRKPPAAGSDMAINEGKIYLLKGNRTLEFWRYNADLPLRPAGGTDGPMAENALPLDLAPELAVFPNPLAGRGEVRFSLPLAGRVRLTLYDVTGRTALGLIDEERGAGEHRFVLSGAGLSRGVYLAQLVVTTPAGSAVAQQKVVLARD